MIVIDASVAVKWFVLEPGTAEAEMLFQADDERAAPEHILIEVGQALLRQHFAGLITVDHCRPALEQIPRLARLFRTEALAADALEIAASARCSIYDAVYVAAADRWDASVVTADAKLVQQLAGSPWQNRARLLQPQSL